MKSIENLVKRFCRFSIFMGLVFTVFTVEQDYCIHHFAPGTLNYIFSAGGAGLLVFGALLWALGSLSD